MLISVLGFVDALLASVVAPTNQTRVLKKIGWTLYQPGMPMCLRILVKTTGGRRMK